MKYTKLIQIYKLTSHDLWDASIDPSHKSHSAPDKYPPIQYFVTYGTGELRDFYNKRLFLRETRGRRY